MMMDNIHDTINDILNKKIKIEAEKVYIEITSNCNLNCKHCYNMSGISNITLISFEKLKTIFDYVKKNGLLDIALSGGEALLHPDIEQILEYLKDINIKVILLTNGTFINSHYMNIISKFEPNIQVSLEGYDAASNDYIRGEGSFDKSVSFIRELKASNYKGQLSINTVVHKANFYYLVKMKELAKQLDVAYLSFAIMTLAGRVINSAENINLDEDERDETIKYVNEVLQNEHDFPCKGIGVNHVCSMNNVIENDIMKIQPRITSDGNVFPCQMHNSTAYIIGNIHENNLDDIINGDKSRLYLVLSKLRQIYINKCKACAFDKICEKGCIAKAISDTGNPLSTDGMCKFYKKQFKEILTGKKRV